MEFEISERMRKDRLMAGSLMKVIKSEGVTASVVNLFRWYGSTKHNVRE